MNANAPGSVHSLVGTTLGHYRIDELLGQGGMGTVYRAWDERLKRPVALKTIRPDLAARSECRARLAREARAAAGLSHSHIASLFDFDEVDGICSSCPSFSRERLYASMRGSIGSVMPRSWSWP